MSQFYDPRYRVDVIPEQTNPPRRTPGRGPRYLIRKGRVVERDPRSIIGIGLHQTAVDFTATKAKIAAAGGDFRLALARRALNVPTHALAFTEGFFATPIPLLWYAYHGHGMNPYTLACEIDGKYAGDTRDPEGTTWKGPPMLWTAQTRDTARNAVGYLYEEGRRLGMPLEFYFAHRQFTSKSSDPGEQIWVEVGIDFCERELKLKPRIDHHETDRNGNRGSPIPSVWDPRSDHPYRG